VARQQLAALDAGETTPHTAERTAQSPPLIGFRVSRGARLRSSAEAGQAD
jgi:hypothetical protein